VAKSASSVHHYRLGRLLRTARRAKDVTQEQLAAKLGLHPVVVARFEKGQRRLTVVELLEVTRALGVSPVKVVRRLERAMFQAGGGRPAGD